LLLNHQLSLPEWSCCWINWDVIRLNRSLQDEFWSIKVEAALLDVVGNGARNEVAERTPTRRKRTELTARVGEVEAVKVEETILASREVACQPGTIRRWCSRSRERGNTSEVQDRGWILPLMEAEE
jgi:hypothetical protein